MPCIKTGAHVYIEPYGEYVWCDAFSLDARCNWNNAKLASYKVLIEPVYLFRIVRRSFEPLTPRLHFTVHSYDQWFDNGSFHPSTHKGISTMFSAEVTNHGYEGKEL
jgi:hypothetical protein